MCADRTTLVHPFQFIYTFWSFGRDINGHQSTIAFYAGFCDFNHYGNIYCSGF